MGYHAIGIVEVNFFTNAVVVLDEMMKTSEVALISCHKTLGGRMVHSVLAGNTSAVDAAMERAREAEEQIGKGNVKVAVTISNPHPEVLKLMNMIEEQLSD